MKKYFFLLVDDDPDDSELFKEALNEVDNSAVFYHAENGEAALTKLSQLPLPEIIFLDINMPRMNGWEFLRELKYVDHYKAIPVIMYSTTSHPEEIQTANALGANFQTKPSSYSELKKMLIDVIDRLKESSLESLSLVESNPIAIGSNH